MEIVLSKIWSPFRVDSFKRIFQFCNNRSDNLGLKRFLPVWWSSVLSEPLEDVWTSAFRWQAGPFRSPLRSRQCALWEHLSQNFTWFSCSVNCGAVLMTPNLFGLKILTIIMVGFKYWSQYIEVSIRFDSDGGKHCYHLRMKNKGK